MGNEEIHYPDILPKNSHQNSCPCHAMHVSKLTLTSTCTTAPQRTTMIHENGFKLFFAHLTNIYEMVNNPVINILMEPESNIRNFQIAVKTHWQNVVQ